MQQITLFETSANTCTVTVILDFIISPENDAFAVNQSV